MRIPTLLIAGVVVGAAGLDSELLDPKRDFCVHAWHQSAVLDNTLYIVGGFVVYDFNNTRYEEPNTYLRALDLTAPFTLNNANTAPFTFTPNPSAVPEISSGALWPTNSTLYLAGGVTEPVDTNFPNWTSSADNALWTYQPSEKAWKTPQPTLRFPSGAKIPSSAGSNAAFVESTDTGYLLGGNQDPWFGVGYAGMLAYDFGAQTWENISTPFTQWSSGALVHVPIGQKGILVSLGGTQNNEMFTFSQVEIYNLDTNSWSTRQAATATVAGGGGVPVPRKSFCAVLMSASDGKSFQIFVYGGTFNGDFSGEPPQLEDVWVLSMPSFEWFNVYNGTNNTAAAGKREAHSCHAVAGRQMLVYGGRSKPQQNQTCDKTGVFAFDMVDLAWQTEFKPAAGPYQVPDIVAKHLASNSSRFPVAGLADPKIQLMFENTDTRNPETPTESGSPPQPDSHTPKPDSRTKTRTAGYIVGGVIAGLFFTTCVAFYFLRRPTVPPKSADSSSSVEIPDTQFSSYYTTEMPHHSPPVWELSASPRNSVARP